MKDSSSSAARGSTISRASTSRFRAARSRSSRVRRAPASRRWRSTRSTPRASDATSNRCRPTRGSSSSGWRSRTSTRSKACRPPSRSSRRIPPRRRGRPSAPPPRSTTICGCSGRASAARFVRSAGARCAGHGAVGHRRGPRARRRHALLRHLPAASLREVTHEVVVENLRAQGFVRVALDGAIMHLDELMTRGDRRHVRQAGARRRRSTRRRRRGARPPRRRRRHRVSRRRRRLRHSVHRADSVRAHAKAVDAAALHRAVRVRRTTARARRRPTPQLFSFNSPRGACERCNGFGATLEYDETLIVPYPTRSLRDGAIDPWTKPRYDNKRRALAEFAKREGISMDVPWQKLSGRARGSLLHAQSAGLQGHLSRSSSISRRRSTSSTSASFCGSIRRRRSAPTVTAPSCSRRRFRFASAVATIAEVSELPVDRLLDVARDARADDVRAAGRRAHPQGGARSRAVPLRRRARTI